jgi:hypothetical protein
MSERLQTRELIHLSPAQLASKARHRLSMATEYAARESFRRAYFSDRLPALVFPAWTHYRRKALAAWEFKIPDYRLAELPSTQRYVAEFERINKLKPLDT